MSAVKEKIWFLREGLFAKYVVSLVGLVVFVLAVNGAMETWISYRGTRVALVDAMGEKAEATARRIEQSISELERQISWVTRASADASCRQRRADYAQLLNQLPAVSQLSFLSGTGRELLRMSRTAGDDRRRRRLFPRHPLYRDRRQGRHLRAGLFRRLPPLHVDRGVAFRRQRRGDAGRDRPALSQRFPRRRPGRQGRLRLCGRCPRPGAGGLEGPGSRQGARPRCRRSRRC